jgi:hypothetical protein
MQTSPLEDVWVPPEGLQRAGNISANAGGSYTLFFPLELKNKDYVRRILDIVALGIQPTVKQMNIRHRNTSNFKRIDCGDYGSYDFANTCDVYYLLKHIMRENNEKSDKCHNASIYAKGMSSAPVARPKFHASLIVFAEFKADKEELVGVCNTLKACRQTLMHCSLDSGSLAHLSSSFEAAWTLLAMFPANEFLAALVSLQSRYKKHKQFDKERKSALQEGVRIDWAPPEDLQRIDAPKPDGRIYTKFFPIEIKKNDYVRRVLDIVSVGIQPKVKDMCKRHGWPHDFAKKNCDLSDLVKHVVHEQRKYAEGTNRCRPFY